MKKLYKYFSLTVLSGILVLSLSFTANAQHHDGGGGGSQPSSGGGGHVSAAPAPSSSRPSSSQSYSRPATQSYSRSTATHPAVTNYNRSGYVQRSGSTTQRTNYSGHATTTTGGSVNSYRSYQGSAYGHNYPGYSGPRTGYLPGHAYYHYNGGYYNSYYAPRLGFSVGYLPYGYYPFYWDDYQYFYSQGLYYQFENDQYTVVEPPVGAEVSTLPPNAQSIVINGQQYYEVNGVYYEPITKDDGTLSYQIAGKDGELNTDNQGVDNAPAPPQVGDIITTLPPNCRKININGQKLYLSEDGIYYQAVLDQDGNKVYKIVGLPADDDQQQAPQQN